MPFCSQAAFSSSSIGRDASEMSVSPAQKRSNPPPVPETPTVTFTPEFSRPKRSAARVARGATVLDPSDLDPARKALAAPVAPAVVVVTAAAGQRECRDEHGQQLCNRPQSALVLLSSGRPHHSASAARPGVRDGEEMVKKWFTRLRAPARRVVYSFTIEAMAKVLIVEDDDVIAQGMARHLEAAGFDPSAVARGDAGLARLRFERPDVCVLDLMLPGRDGWNLIETVRTEGIGTPIVVVSARGTEHDRVHALELGADDYLVKPFSMKELVARVRAAARRGVRAEEAERGGRWRSRSCASRPTRCRRSSTARTRS